MPFVKNTEKRLAVARHIGLDVDDVNDDTTYKETFYSAMRLDNEVGSLLARDPDLLDGGPADPDFNPWEHMTEDEQLDEHFVINASTTMNKNQLAALRRHRDRQLQDARTLEEAPMAASVSARILAGLLSPLNLIPFKSAHLTYKGGAGILKGGLVTAGMAGGTMAAQEAMLHATQTERTFGQSALDISVATLLGGALGAGVTKLAARRSGKAVEADDIKLLAKEVEQSLDPEPIVAAGGDSVGAMKVFNDVVLKGKTARALAKILPWDPLARAFTSPIKATRVTMARLAESPYAFEQGAPQAVVETRAGLYEGLYYRAHKLSRKAYSDYRKEGGKLTQKEFNEEVADEIGDPVADANPHTKRAADAYHNEVFEPIKKEAIGVKLFKENVHVTTALRYISRIWDKGKVAANLPRVVRIFSDHLKKTQGKELAEAGIDPDELANDIASVIIGSHDGKLPYDYKIGDSTSRMAGKGLIKGPYSQHQLKSPFQERTFDIPDKLVKDFLERDIEVIAARHVKQMGMDIEITREFGDINMGHQLDDIQKEWMEKIKNAKTEKERVKLSQKMKKDLATVAGIRDRLRGVYNVPNEHSFWTRIGRSIRDLDYLRLMGGVVASSLSDVARPFMVEGFANTFRHGLKPLIANIKGFKVAAGEAREWGVAFDSLRHGKAEIIADIGDYVQGGNVVERGLRAAAHQYSQINLLNQWTTGIKTLHAVVLQGRVSKMLLAGKYDKRLANFGISEHDAQNIAAQLKKHGVIEDGVFIANSRKWESQELARMWGGMLRKESNRALMMPGQEKPLFMSTELGKTIFQFRSFTFSSLQRVTIAGIQGQDQNFMGGLVMMVSMGMLAATFKNWDAGRPQPEDATALVMEGFDYSGALGILMEANNTLEKISTGNLGIRPLLGVDVPASRYASRSQSEALLGPSFGSFLSTTLQVAGAASNEREWDESDTRAVRRLLPYQNLLIFRQGVDKIEASIQ